MKSPKIDEQEKKIKLKKCVVKIKRENWNKKRKEINENNKKLNTKMKKCFVKVKKLTRAEEARAIYGIRDCFVRLEILHDNNNNNNNNDPVALDTKPEVNCELISSKINSRICPSYNFIKNTNFIIDAFNYDNLDHVEHYFLSCYRVNNSLIKIPNNFKKKIYLSHVTGRILMQSNQVDRNCLQFIAINETITVEDVEVTALDAHKFPGGIMFLFKLKTGQHILYTGDFIANPCMEEYPQFWTNQIDYLYLNLNLPRSQLSTITKDDGLEELIEHCDKFLEQSRASGTKCMFVYDSRNAIETKNWMQLAAIYNFHVYVDSKYRSFLECLDDNRIMDVLTTDKNEATLHIVPIEIESESLSMYLCMFGGVHNLLAIQIGHYDTSVKIICDKYPIKIIGFNYTEYSKLGDINRFIKYLGPQEIISTNPFQLEPSHVNGETDICV